MKPIELTIPPDSADCDTVYFEFTPREDRCDIRIDQRTDMVWIECSRDDFNTLIETLLTIKQGWHSAT